ncbi:MAG TPA: ABC transporter permease subunit, partial [Aliiroseovarius sp.]|nr:ABC transporter permease subunit [Aliiroseovarius sp.]
MKWLVDEASFGVFTFQDLTRSLAWLIEQPYDAVRALLADGIKDGPGRRAKEILPPLSWLTITAAAMALGHYARSWGLALIVGVSFLYLSVFGQWESAMVTLSSVIIAVPIGVVGGLGLGILAYRHRRFERALTPVLDLMQTIPVFAYLVPILVLFGFGPVAALVATVIYAMPPMVRITILALQGVSSEIKDFGTMCGCTPRQMTWRVVVPSARAGLMVGVNQVIMLSLNMVIIASMIGAGGLGFDVLSALRRLDIGGGFEAGIAIVILAVAVDRLSQALSERASQHRAPVTGSLWRRYRRSAMVLTVLVISFVLGRFWPLFQEYPKAWWLTTGDFWDNSVKYLNINYYDAFESVKLFFLNWFLLPTKRFFLGLPWPWVLAMLVLAGWRFGGWKLSALNGALTLFILVTGMWEKAMITVYLCGVAVFLASAIGIPLGIWAATGRRAGRIIGVVIDTLQTLPSFVYLIPVVMLFRIGDFTAMVA